MIADITCEVRLLPLRATHDVVVVGAHHVAVESVLIQDLGVQERVVCDVADVQHAWRPAVHTTEFFRTCGGDGLLQLGGSVAGHSTFPNIGLRNAKILKPPQKTLRLLTIVTPHDHGWAIWPK